MTTPADVAVDSGVRLPAEELCALFLFESLTKDQLEWIAAHGWVSELPAGAVVFAEGEPADVLVLLLGGAVSMTQRVGRDDVEINRTDHIGAYAGAVRAFAEGHDEDQRHSVTLRVVRDARFFVLKAEDFVHLIRTWFPMAVHLLDGMFLGLRNSQQVVGAREQLLALGSLAAGLTHELNNPAAAAVRAAAGLRDRVAAMRHKLAMLAHGEVDPRLLELLVDVQEEAVLAAANAPALTALQVARREDEIADWLEDHGIADGWELAPIFVAGGTSDRCLDRIAGSAPPDVLAGALRWLASTLETESLLGEITDSVTRISSLIASAKQYSNMDRSPYERVDVHLGLESSLVMMSGKTSGLKIVKEFDRSLPAVPAYPGELNQVWTNLIDNAVQAMGGEGTLTLRTALDGDRLRVEIGDTGPGVPPELQQRIFQPFFTTKPVGQGTGLGLDISHRIVVQRHGGDLSVESAPGDTRFLVRLPLTERRTAS